MRQHLPEQDGLLGGPEVLPPAHPAQAPHMDAGVGGAVDGVANGGGSPTF